MSNPLSVRRVQVQTLDELGQPVGKPTFGVMAADNHCSAYNDTFESFEELNQEIEKAGSILAVASDWTDFGPIKPGVIGTDNYYGKDWAGSEDDDAE